MNHERVDRLLANFHQWFEEATNHAFEGDDLVEELGYRMSLVEKVKEGIAILEPTPDETKFGVALVTAVYMTAMNEAAGCAQAHDGEQTPMQHRVNHVASSIQDYVVALMQLEEVQEEAT